MTGAMQVDTPVAAAVPESPVKPKKALSGYWIFSNEKREEVIKAQKEASGKVKFGEIAKELSAKWAALSEAERKPYEDLAAADKERFAREHEAYMEASDPAGTLRKKYQHLIPKKPTTAYFLFSADPANRDKAAEALKVDGKETGTKQLAAKLSEMWKGASAEERAAYEERYKKDHVEFLEKQKAWQATPEFAEIESAEKAQGERRKAVESERKGEAQDKDQADAKIAKKRGRPAASESTPRKTPKQSAPASESKRPRKAAGPEAAPQIDAGVLAEAAKLGYEGALKNLAARPEILASGKSVRVLLEALQASGGLVNPAKRAILEG